MKFAARVLAAIERIAKGCAIAAGVPADRMPTVKVREDEFTPRRPTTIPN